MIRTKTTFEAAPIAALTLKLAATKGWKNLTLEMIAKAAKIPALTFKHHFVSLNDLVPVIAAEIDRQGFKAVGQLSGSAHDRLFDTLMARFDILQRHRQAILSMADAAQTDRALSCALARATLDGVYRVIGAVNIDAPPRPLLAAGIGMIYGWGFFVWRHDESPDMSKTMATLDRGLRLAGKALKLLDKNSSA